MRLWLDDIRPMPPGFDVHVKTVEEAVICIASGSVKHISFDHDLGPALDRPDPSEGSSDVSELTGYDLAKHIEKTAHGGGLSRITWEVHSANPVGKKNIIASMSNADEYWSSWEETRAIMSDPRAMESLRQAEEDSKASGLINGDEVRRQCDGRP